MFNEDENPDFNLIIQYLIKKILKKPLNINQKILNKLRQKSIKFLKGNLKQKKLQYNYY